MSHDNTDPTHDLRTAPLPTAKTLKMRQNLPYQAYRFGRVNLRMLKLVRRSHTS